MSAARVVAVLTLALSAGMAAAQPPLLIGVLQSDDTEPVLRLAFQREGAQWKGLDPVAGERKRPGFPAFPDNDDGAKPATLPLAAFGQALFNGTTPLETWYGATPAGKPLKRRALHAEQGKWACTRTWGLRLDARSGAGDLWSVLATEPMDARYFQPSQDPVDLSASQWQLTTPKQDQGAIAGFRVNDGFKDLKAPVFQPWQLLETQRLRLDGGESLLSVAAVRLLQPLAPEQDRCSVPMMVATAVFRIDSSGTPRRIDSDASVQRCDDAGEPSPMSKPWALLQLGGETLLLHWRFGAEAQRLGLSRVDLHSETPQTVWLAQGAESGC